jgi:two-component system, chemotaxis family, protein-glutamate methylesterase/glutaminase
MSHELSPRLVVVGTSMGGLHALSVILSQLGADFALPIAVVQHRGTDGESAMLTSLLQLRCALPVSEANDKEPLMGGHVYLAPPDYHLLVDGGRFALSTEARVQHARPSIDVLFESAADVYAARTLGVVLTGANADGAAGSMRIKRRGGRVVAQDPTTAEAPEMPSAAIGAGAVDRVLRLEEIGRFLNVAAFSGR